MKAVPIAIPALGTDCNSQNKKVALTDSRNDISDCTEKAQCVRNS